MNRIFILFFLLCFSHCSEDSIAQNNNENYVQDKAGNTYTYKQFKDGHLWLTQNINTEIEDSYCYDDNAANCKEYGRLYTWEAAKKACSTLGEDWRLPTDLEWQTLAQLYGGERIHGLLGGGNKAYQALIKGGDSGFDALLSGNGNDYAGFLNLNTYGFYWTNTQSGEDNAWTYAFNVIQSVSRMVNKKSGFFSCRCINTQQSSADDKMKDATAGNIQGTITDKDGNEYPYQKMKAVVGGKLWLTKNLNTAIEGSFCYDNKPENCAEYGRLYPWDAAKKGCEQLGAGWRLPSNNDWDNLLDVYGGVQGEYGFQPSNDTGAEAFKALIEGGISGFEAKLGGRYQSTFKLLGKIGHYWSANDFEGIAYEYQFFNFHGKVIKADQNKSEALSCRCVKGL